MAKLDEVGQELVQKYESGKTLGQLAREYEVSAPTVSRRLRALGVDIRSKGRRKKERAVEYLPDHSEPARTMELKPTDPYVPPVKDDKPASKHKIVEL